MPKFDRRNRRPHQRPAHAGPKHRPYQHFDQLAEPDVGISGFVSALPGFSGVIKARFSDFQVNEIDAAGGVARLSDQTMPAAFRKERAAPGEGLAGETPSPLAALPQATWSAIRAMLRAGAAGQPVAMEAPAKAARAEIHALLRTAFGRKVVAQVAEAADGTKTMTFSRFDPKASRDQRSEWPENVPEYVHFIVYKELMDTMEACMKIADTVRIAPSNFNYAGVKDKRAKTSQWFSARKIEPWKLLKRAPSYRNNLRIGNITFKEHPLKLGQLKGNRFRIALRNVIGDEALIESRLDCLKTNGFINYYGLQRFGNRKEVPTFAVGVQLLLGNWKEACELILKLTKDEDQTTDVAQAKKVYSETKDATLALKKFNDNRNKCVECLLLDGLCKENKNDYVNALSKIPRNMRLLYLHSFQSLIWNRMVSLRIEKFGMKCVVGDLILLNANEIEPIEDDVEENDDEKEIVNRQEVRALIEEDLANYCFDDIVLPLPGYDITYPENLKNEYREQLESFGLTLEMPKQRVETYTLSGNYRKLLGRVENLSWKFMKYTDPNYNLILSDFEELRKFDEPVSIADGKYNALVLQFDLKSASYATMVLRELLKTDTGSGAHAKLNDYASESGDQTIKKVENVDDVLVEEKIALLEDKDKFEAFKSIVFNELKEDTSSSLKRACEESESGDLKKTKQE